MRVSEIPGASNSFKTSLYSSKVICMRNSIGRHQHGLKGLYLHRWCKSCRLAALSKLSTNSSGNADESTPSIPSIAEGNELFCNWKRFQKEQRQAKKLTPAEAAKTVICNGRFGVLCAISSRDDLAGYPVSSYVNYATDPHGRPIFSVTIKSYHTKDMYNNERISLFVLEGGSLDAREQQAVLTGIVEPVLNDVGNIRELYLNKAPGSFWVDFGDFRWFRVKEVLNVRYIPDVQNVARNIKRSEYYDALSDPVAEFSPKLSKELNERRGPEILKLSEVVVREHLDKAILKRVDHLGMDLRCSKPGLKHFPCRMPFAKEAHTYEELLSEIDHLLTNATKM